MKTITATFPARKNGKFNYCACTVSYRQDDQGKWFGCDLYGSDDSIHNTPRQEADVIDDCKHATNWSALCAAHFPMFGFHS